MPRLIKTFFIFSLTFFAIVVAEPPSPEASASQGENIRLMVEMKRPAADGISDRAPREYRVSGARRRAADLRRWQVIEVPAHDIQQVKDDPAVASVHEEQLYHTAAIPNDPRFIEQIGLNNEVWPLDINAPEAWEKTTGSSSTVIAVIDGGVDLTHEDLRDKIVPGWDFVVNAPAGIAIDHATHVAGIAAASSNNGLGVAGVDWWARIMSVRVLNSSGVGRESDIIKGIDYAVEQGAKVINLSIVGPSTQALVDAVENAYAAGVVVVAAAGNSGANTGVYRPLPACADVGGVNMVLGVGALDDEGEPANFSNFGTCVDVSAPGKDILSTKVGNRYGTMKGTSMSSPFVAGVAGLYLSLHPNASPAEVIGAITRNVTVFTGEKADEWTEDYRGRLNAAAVVGASVGTSMPGSPSPSPLPTTPTPAPAPQPSTSENSGSGSADGGGSSGGNSGGSEEPQPTPKPRVAGVKISISAADRKAPDFIQNKNVPAVVARLFQSVWGRKITPVASGYWKLRARGDKATETKLRRAMAWHKARGKKI